MSELEDDASMIPDELAEAIHELRGAMIAAITSVGADPTKPRELGRQFKVDKTLAWKVSRMVGANSAQEALQFLPGDAAIELFIEAVKVAGGSEAALARTRKVVDGLKQSVERHVGDRPTLDIVLDGLPSQRQNRLIASRKLAFRGNSGIWGVHARCRVQSAFVFRNQENPDRVDAAMVVGWVDFRRLRKDAKWVLFRHSLHSMDGTVKYNTEPIDPDAGSVQGVNFLKEFCSEPMPSVTPVVEKEQVKYLLNEGPVGNAGGFTCFMGSVGRGIGKVYADKPGEAGIFGAVISAPVENVLFDVFIHRDVPMAGPPTVQVLSGFASSANPEETDILPVAESVREIGGRPPVVDTPLLPRYGEMVGRVQGMLGFGGRDFVGYRYSMTYPPFPSTVRCTVPMPLKG